MGICDLFACHHDQANRKDMPRHMHILQNELNEICQTKFSVYQL